LITLLIVTVLTAIIGFGAGRDRVITDDFKKYKQKSEKLKA